MCVIVDANCLSAMFRATDARHSQVKPIRKWIEGAGKLIVGGTKYSDELKRMPRALGAVAELEKRRRVVRLSTTAVDTKELAIAAKRPGFNDYHLAAMVAVSRCRVVCSLDKRAFDLLKDSSIYPKHCKRPRLYQSIRNSNLLCANNIVEVCKA